MAQMQQINFGVTNISASPLNESAQQSQIQFQTNIIKEKAVRSVSQAPATVNRKPLEFKGSKWMKKVDELIQQFDER